MICENCGTKNDISSKFCESCGSALKAPVQPVQAKEKKPLSKQTKMVIGGLVVAVIAVIGIFLFLSSMFTPEKEATKYFEAVMNRDFDKLYSYVDVKKSSLTTKKVFKEIMDEQEDDDNYKKLMNYKVTKTENSLDGLSIEVTISYVLEGSSSSSEKTITLAKDKKKKFLFFDNWKIQNSTLECIENTKLEVLAGSKVEIAGVELKKSNLNTQESTSEYDVYNLPAMFKTEYPVEVEFPYGFEIETSFTPSSYYATKRIDVDEDALSAESKQVIINAIKKNLTTIYNAAIANKEFSAIKSDFEYTGSDLSDLESEYTSFKTSLNNRTRKLTKITFDDVEIRSLSTDDGMLEVNFRANCDYEVKYKSGDTDKTSSSDSYMYSYMTFDYNNTYQLVDIDNFKYYFY